VATPRARGAHPRRLTVRRAATALAVVACVVPAWTGVCRAQAPYDLGAAVEVERGAPEPAVERGAPEPAVERGAPQPAVELEAPDRAVERVPDRDVERAFGGVADDRDVSPEIAQAVQQLRAAEWIDRLTGIYALQRMGADAAPAAAALADEHGSVRFESAEALFRIGAPAVPYLVAIASRGGDEESRAAAVRTLGRIGLGARDAVPALERLRDDPSPEVAEQVAFALPLVAPHGPRDWLWKLGFEIGDEPWGIPIVMGAFLGLVLGKTLWDARRRSRRALPPDDAGRLRPPTSSGPAAGAPAAHGGDRDRAGGDTARADDDEDEDDEDDDEDDDDDDAVADERGARRGGGITVDQRAGGVGDPLQPPQGLPHALAGLAAMAVATLVAFLGALKELPEERHGVWHFAALFFLFGSLFFRIGLAGEREARRARRRRDASTERWLQDRAWDRTGTDPIRIARVWPNVVSLALWVGFLLPFHTVWALPWSYWGVWIVLGLFDVLAVVMLVGVLRNVWRVLRSGRCRLRWDGVPVRPGGTFAARFETARALGDGVQLEATLRCLRDRAENRVIGAEHAVDAEEIWAEKRSFRVHDRPEGGSWVQLSFPVPAKAHGTDSYASRPVRWVVEVSIPMAGPDFATTFPVPIYR